MTIRIEFYGIPRRRAGIESIEVEAADLGSALRQLAVRLPEFARACLSGDRLQAGYLANINGRLFATDPSTLLEPGDTVLILSADAGG